MYPSALLPSGCVLMVNDHTSWRHERDIGLAGLDNHLTEPGNSVNNRVEAWAKLGPISILPLNERTGGGKQEVGIAEALHHEQRLRVAGHALVGQPYTQGLLVREALCFDALVPGRDILACTLFEQAGRHLPHSLPVTRLCHRNLHALVARRPPERSTHSRDGLCNSQQPCVVPAFGDDLYPMGRP